jgi:hypothetical protein
MYATSSLKDVAKYPGTLRMHVRSCDEEMNAILYCTPVLLADSLPVKLKILHRQFPPAKRAHCWWQFHFAGLTAHDAKYVDASYKSNKRAHDGGIIISNGTVDHATDFGVVLQRYVLKLLS